MDSTEIQEYIKNRYPYLMVDRITKVVPGELAEGYKNCSNNDWFFPCHYEGHMNMPGMIQVEVLIEVFIIAFLTLPGYKGMRTSDVQLNKVKFKQEVYPGDRLDVIAQIKNFRHGIAKGIASGYVEGTEVCSAELVVAIPDIVKEIIPQ